MAYERRGSGLPLLLIHGFPLDHSVWLQFSPYLEKSFDVIMPDSPGFGESDMLAGDFTIDQIAAALSCLLDELDIKKVYVIGHSMGGYISLAFARLFPEKVIGLGLLGSQARADAPERIPGRFQTAQDVSTKGVGVLAGMAEKMTVNPEYHPFVREIILRQPAQGMAGALKAMAGRLDSTVCLSSFKFPVILVHGNSDELIPIDRSREIHNILPQSSLIELNHIGHSPMLEAPQETASSIMKFLES